MTNIYQLEISITCEILLNMYFQFDWGFTYIAMSTNFALVITNFITSFENLYTGLNLI